MGFEPKRFNDDDDDDNNEDFATMLLEIATWPHLGVVKAVVPLIARRIVTRAARYDDMVVLLLLWFSSISICFHNMHGRWGADFNRTRGS